MRRLLDNAPASSELAALWWLAQLAHCSCNACGELGSADGRRSAARHRRQTGTEAPRSAPHGLRPIRLLAVRPGECTWEVRDPGGARAVLRVVERVDWLADLRAENPVQHDRVRSARPLCAERSELFIRPWVEGRPFSELALQTGRRTISRLLVWFRDLAVTLDSLLNSGSAPAYLAPQNLFLDRFGRVILTDLCFWQRAALSELRAGGLRPPLYFAWIAPEVFRAPNPDFSRSLVFSLAACAAQLLGTPAPMYASHAEDRYELAHWHFERKLRARGIPAPLRRLLLAGCCPDVDQRPASPTVWVEELVEIARARPPVPSGSDPHPWLADRPAARPRPTWQPWVRSMTAGIAIGATATVAVVGTRMALTNRLVPLRIAPPSPVQESQLWEVSRPRRWDVRTQAELTKALRDARDGDVVMLASTGPFRVPDAPVTVSLTLMGHASVQPVLLVGDRGFHVRASSLTLENVHFVVLGASTSSGSSAALVAEVDELELTGCSFQPWNRPGATRDGIAVVPFSPGASPRVVLERVFLKGLVNQIDVRSTRGGELQLRNVLATGGSRCLVLQASGADDSRFSCSISRSTIYGATVLNVSAPPPRLLPWVDVRAVRCLFVPRNRSRPVIELQYGRRPAAPVERLTWQGTESLLPHEAQLLRAVYHSDGAFVLASVSEWQRFWGNVDTGVVGIPLPFLDALPPGATLRLSGKQQGEIGVDVSLLRFPDLQTIARLLSEADVSVRKR